MTLDRKLAKFNAKAEYDDRATWSNPQWRVFIIHVLARRLAMPLSDVNVWGHATLLFCAGNCGECRGAGQRKKMIMNPEELKIVVRFVESNPGSSKSEIAKACPAVQDLSALLAEASEGAKPKEGYILKCSDGLYYPGPFVNLGY